MSTVRHPNYLNIIIINTGTAALVWHPNRSASEPFGSQLEQTFIQGPERNLNVV